jgi:TolB-like protein/tetratricopeptide (TPR) repeat protein
VRYFFEDYVLDTDRHELSRNRLIVPAASQAIDLLTYLIRHRDRIVTKDQLVADVWEGRAVTDSALTTRLNVLRGIIGDSGQAQRLIRTLPRKGFRFVGDVGEGCSLPSLHHEIARELPSIAVLPLVNLSGDPRQDFFGDVISDEVLTELARLRWLLVIARNSSFLFRRSTVDPRDIGRQLAVRYVLEGSARRDDARVRVACRLVDTSTALQVWSARYDRTFTDLFDIQDEIVSSVVAELVPAILNAERVRSADKIPQSLSAWESSQRGVWHMLKQSADDNLCARRFFQQAVDLAPGLSSGHDGLAWTYLMESSAFRRISLAEGCKQSETLACKAIALDPENSAARARLALTMHLTGDNSAAIAEAERALSISPNCADACGVRGTALVFSGERAQGRASLQRYLQLSPRDPARPIRLSQIAASHYLEQDYARAAELAYRTVQEYPTVHFAYRWLAASLGQLGQVSEGAAVVASLRRTCATAIDNDLARRPVMYRQEDYEHLVDGLAKVGWLQ